MYYSLLALLNFLKVYVVIQNNLAQVTVFQEYINLSNNSVSTEYLLPSLPNGVFNTLKIHLPDGSILNSDILRKKEAQDKFDQASSDGKTAIISYKNDDENLEIQIGNIEPNQTVSVEIECIYTLETEKDFWVFEFLNGIIPKDKYNYKLDFTIQIISDSEIIDLTSNWPFQYEKTEDRKEAIAFLDPNKEFAPDKKLKFKYSTVNIIIPKCLIQHHDGQYAVMLSFIPYTNRSTDIHQLEFTAEYIFVLDRSGSMMGESIELAKRSAVLFLKSLPSSSTFNIVSFGSHHSFLYPQSVPAISYNIDKSIKNILSFDADMGGTNIYNPLLQIFSLPIIKSYPRHVFLLTDGHVENSEMVVGLIKVHSKHARVSSFGINDADELLIQNSAKAGKGKAYFIKDPNDIGKKVIEGLDYSLVPGIIDWEILWSGDIVPSNQDIGLIKYGESFTVFALLNTTEKAYPVLKGYDISAQEYKEFRIDHYKEIPGNQIFSLWAVEKIRSLENQNSSFENIIEISIKYKVLSKHTAYYIEKQDKTGLKSPVQSILEDTELKETSFKLFSPSRSFNFAKANSHMKKPKIHRAAMFVSMEANELHNMEDMFASMKGNELQDIYNYENNESDENDESDKNDESDENDDKKSDDDNNKNVLFEIVKDFQSEGFWTWESLVKNIKLVVEKQNILQMCSQDLNVCATAGIIFNLREKFSNYVNEWFLIEIKALKWLKSLGYDYEEIKKKFIV